MDLQTMMARVREIIVDTDVPYYVSDDILTDYITFGVYWVSTRISPVRNATITLTGGVGSLPADFRNLRSVFGDEQLLKINRLDEDGPYPVSGECVLIGDSTLRVGDDDLASVEVYYDGVYTAPVNPGDFFEMDLSLQEAVMYYAAARSLAQRASDEAKLDQWDSSNDSGNPEHNPLLKAARHYEEMAERVLNSYAYVQV